MPKLNPPQALFHLFDKISSIENIIQENAELLKKSIRKGEEGHFFINHGIEGYKEKILNELKVSEKSNIKEKLLSTFCNDTTLRYPHRKILDFLIEQYDYQKGKFREIHFSRIVKECRLGKNKAKEYLEFLLKKGLIEYRTDGYRKFYKIKVDSNR